MRDIKSGKIPEGSTIVCTLTGHGLKDPDTAITQCKDTMININPVKVIANCLLYSWHAVCKISSI
jgi:threonine synthase